MSVSVLELWMVWVLAGILCWVASALIHMLIKYHNADYSELPNEEQVSAALAALNPKPAMYSMPYCADMKAMGEEKMQKKFTDGPVAMLSVLPNGMPPMGKLLGQQAAFFIVGSLLIAYLVSMSLSAGADFMMVFRPVFVAAVLTYGWAQISYSIWMGQPWSNCIRYLVDAVIYAGVTAVTFALMWP